MQTIRSSFIIITKRVKSSRSLIKSTEWRSKVRWERWATRRTMEATMIRTRSSSTMPKSMIWSRNAIHPSLAVRLMPTRRELLDKKTRDLSSS